MKKINIDDATRAVKHCLMNHPEELAIHKVKCYKHGWCFFYNTKQYIETGNLEYCLIGNLPIFISMDGRVYRAPFFIDNIDDFVQGIEDNPGAFSQFEDKKFW